jgi:threonyl-tRNA synthetase
MEKFLHEELEKGGYSFVYTPHIAKRELWKISGHEDNYADSMYAPTSIEDEEYRLKPMNCPMHIGIYKSNPRSYRDLPQRYSEAGTVYRAELSGALHGLMRVRGFTVDDAHLFVRPDQIQAEISDCLDFAIKVFDTYGFDKVKFELSVRGAADNKLYLGTDETWRSSEEQLARALDTRGIQYERIEGEAAFYGPKIDIKIEDAIGRIWQLGTIQVDWNLPSVFNSSTRPRTIRNSDR